MGAFPRGQGGDATSILSLTRRTRLRMQGDRGHDATWTSVIVTKWGYLMRLSETLPGASTTRSGSAGAQLEAERTYSSHGERTPPARRRLLKPMATVAGVVLLLAAVPAGVFVATQRLAVHADQVNQDCMLIVPDEPLTARGLATPYQLTARVPTAGPCHEANADQAAFVQGAILDPATGTISIYNPLVVDEGTAPAVAPTMPTLPDGAVVALWFGFNGGTLHVRTAHRGTLELRTAHSGKLEAARCVNGLGNSIFGQVAYCNAPEFFRVANELIGSGKLSVPALGTAQDGLPCPTVRDFSVVDQDQSDNVTTTYLVTADGQTAQNTAANAAALAANGAGVTTNASDNRLLSVALDTALGCTPWKAPNLADGGNLVPALPLNELQAAMDQASPVATVPSTDPMVLDNGSPNLAKQNLYRAGVDQTRVRSASQAAADSMAYCRNLYAIAPARLLRDQAYLTGRPSPVPAAANSLFTFMAQRFVFTFEGQGLGCTSLLGVADPITLQVDANGVTTDATINVPASASSN